MMPASPKQMRQRRQYRGGSRRHLVENPEQARIPAGRSLRHRQRRSSEEHHPKTGQQPGGPWLRNPGRAVRPPPRSARDHRDKAAGAWARWPRRRRRAAPPAWGRIADTKTMATSAGNAAAVGGQMSWPAMVAAHATAPEAGGGIAHGRRSARAPPSGRQRPRKWVSRERRVDHDRLRPWYTAVTRRGPAVAPWLAAPLPAPAGSSLKDLQVQPSRAAPISAIQARVCPSDTHERRLPPDWRFEGTRHPGVRAVTSRPATGLWAGRLEGHPAAPDARTRRPAAAPQACPAHCPELTVARTLASSKPEPVNGAA